MITRIRQAMGDLLAEIYSWLRWTYYKKLPSWLSAPFRYSLFKILYFLAITALILIFIPVGLWQDLIRQALHDIWVQIIGEGSVSALASLLAGFQTSWGLPVIIALCAWGLIAWLWAWPRHNFYKVIEEAGVVVLRGPGERLLFLNRLFDRGVSGLGRGLSTRILPTYIPRDEDAHLRQRMRVLRHRRRDFGVLVTGPATSGKTRTAMELTVALRPALVLVWPRDGETISWPRLPTWRMYAIIIADNLKRAEAGGDVPLPASLVQLLQQCPHLLLVGTIRKDMLTKDLRGPEAVELTEMDKARLQVLANEVAQAESITLGRQVDVGEILHRYNGHPAGLVAGVDAMREIYKKLSPRPRAFLQAARLLWLMGVRSLTLERLWESAELINRIGHIPGVRQELLERLTNPGLITLHENGEARVEIYEGYLDRVIDSPYDQLRLVKRILALWRKRSDAQAFFEHGYALTDEYSLSFQQDPPNALRLGISAYREALRYLTPDRTPLQYAATQNNLGTVYSRLSEHQKPAENLSRAIQAYTEALRYLTPERTSLQYAATQNNLGAAYNDLAAHQEPAENLLRAIQAYTESLRYRTAERAPLDYALTQNNLGAAYSRLADHQEPAENLGRAIQAYTEALRYRTLDRAPLAYAMTQNNLGSAYGNLAAHQEPVENLSRAIQAHTEALHHYTPERAPRDYAMTQNNLGLAYGDLSDHQEPAKNLLRASQAYTEALHYYTPERTPLDYAMTQNDLGSTYGKLAAHQEPIENLCRAIQSYGEALHYYTPERNPLDFAMIHNNLGTAYSGLATHQEPAENLGRAIQSYGEALHYYTPERNPLDYATTQNNLGTAYGFLAAHQKEKEQACADLIKSLQAYAEALHYLTQNTAPLLHKNTLANYRATQKMVLVLGCEQS